MLYVIELGVLIAHLNTYKSHIITIASNFAITFALSKIMQSVESRDKADMIKLGGYSITFGSLVDYLAAVKANSIIDTPKDGGGIIGEGWLKTVIDAMKDIKK